MDAKLYICCTGLQEDKQTEAFSGRKILDERKVVYDISTRSAEEQQPQLAVSLLASVLPCAFTTDTFSIMQDSLLHAGICNYKASL